MVGGVLGVRVCAECQWLGLSVSFCAQCDAD
jgi:hypothetical protein